jgi:hypothetical protein
MALARGFEFGSDLQQLRDLVMTYLEELGVSFVSEAFDGSFYDECCEHMAVRDWSAETISTLRSVLPGGVIMACTAYSHLSNTSTRILIALYTSILIYLDDLCVEHLEELKSFNRILCQKGKHELGVLDAFSQILQELPQHFGDASSLVLTSSLNFITSLVLENEIPHIRVGIQVTN